MMSAATPSAMPTSDATLMNETTRADGAARIAQANEPFDRLKHRAALNHNECERRSPDGDSPAPQAKKHRTVTQFANGRPLDLNAFDPVL